MAARKTAPKLDETAGVPVDADVTEPVKAERKKREPKPVTDLVTANAAFQRAKKSAERATKAAAEARAAEEKANAELAEAARVLKGYLGDVDTAVSGVLPVSATDEAPEVPGWDEAPYEGDGHGDTAHTA